MSKPATQKIQAYRGEKSRYRVLLDGKTIGFVAASITSTSAPLWSAYGRYGTRPVAFGLASRAAAITTLSNR